MEKIFKFDKMASRNAVLYVRASSLGVEAILRKNYYGGETMETYSIKMTPIGEKYLDTKVSHVIDPHKCDLICGGNVPSSGENRKRRCVEVDTYREQVTDATSRMFENFKAWFNANRSRMVTSEYTVELEGDNLASISLKVTTSQNIYSETVDIL